jgi:hypothetical protein
MLWRVQSAITACLARSGTVLGARLLANAVPARAWAGYRCDHHGQGHVLDKVGEGLEGQREGDQRWPAWQSLALFKLVAML